MKFTIDHKPSGTSRAIPKLLLTLSDLVKAEEIQKKAKENLTNFDLLFVPHHGSGSISLHSRTNDKITLAQLIEKPDYTNLYATNQEIASESVQFVDFHWIQAAQWSDNYKARPGAKLQINLEKIQEVSRNINEVIVFDCTDAQLFEKYHELGHLFSEFHELIGEIVQTHRDYIELSTRIYRPEKVDTRKHIRQVSFFLFKCLPDFSGCEEDADFNSIIGLKKYSFISQLDKKCITLPYYSAQLIRSLNLQRTA